jgi:hypothetical protein
MKEGRTVAERKKGRRAVTRKVDERRKGQQEDMAWK